MNLQHFLQILQLRVGLPLFLLRNSGKEKFTCPICGYVGPFKDVSPGGHLRKHATCPTCGAAERHRLQYLILTELLDEMDPSVQKMLHFAPEPFFKTFFSKRFGQYETADLSMHGVDHHVDLQKLPFDNQSYDFVFASHVLEHIPDDEAAIAEIRRILKPNGIAILPIPLITERTVEYPAPNPQEDYHARAPGFDYFDKFDPHFVKVEKISSTSFPEKYQLFIYADRTQWPTKECPLRPAMEGRKHIDIVPVCHA